MELDPYFRKYVKIKPMGEDPNNVRAKTIKQLLMQQSYMILELDSSSEKGKHFLLTPR